MSTLKAVKNVLAELILFFNVKRKLRLIKTNLGRSQGWEVYFGEKKIAELLEPEDYEMFWECYRLAKVDPTFEDQVKTLHFWEHDSISFKSKALGEFVTRGALIFVNEEIVKNKVAARSLYIDKGLTRLEIALALLIYSGKQ